MSTLASFFLLPRTKLDAARKNADTIDRLISKGRPVATYESGNVIATLLPYLEEQHGIDLMKSTTISPTRSRPAPARRSFFSPPLTRLHTSND